MLSMLRYGAAALPETFPERRRNNARRIYTQSGRVYVRGTRSFPAVAAATAGVFLVTEIISPRAYKWIARGGGGGKGRGGGGGGEPYVCAG